MIEIKISAKKSDLIKNTDFVAKKIAILIKDQLQKGESKKIFLRSEWTEPECFYKRQICTNNL